MPQPVQPGPVGGAFVQGRPSGGRGEVIDHHRAARSQQPGGVGRVVARHLAGATAVQDQQVVRAVLLDPPPVAVDHLDLGPVGEDLGRDPGPPGVTLHADQPYALPRPGRQPREPHPAPRTRLTDPPPRTARQDVQQTALLRTARLREAVTTRGGEGPPDERGEGGGVCGGVGVRS